MSPGMGLRKIPFGHFVQADLLEQRCPLFAQTHIPWIGINQTA